MIEYARPQSPEEALSLLARDGAVAMGGATDLAGQLDRGIRTASLLVDLQAAGLGEIRAEGDGLVVGATVTLAELAESPAVAPYASSTFPGSSHGSHRACRTSSACARARPSPAAACRSYFISLPRTSAPSR